MAPQKELIGKREQGPKLEIVLKCDSAGSAEAARTALSRMSIPGVHIGLIHSGVGAINKSDVLLAETGSRLIVGFQVGILPGIDRVLKEHNTEIRTYNVIYALTSDIQALAESLRQPGNQEETIGSAKVIATFKGSRKGIIIGCEIADGFLALGQRFRIISAMGPVYTGIIESIHIGENAVQKATQGQQVGLKIKGFNKVTPGDIVESFRPLPQKFHPWQPSGQIISK